MIGARFELDFGGLIEYTFSELFIIANTQYIISINLTF